jgi:hypothetical protein
MATGESRGKVTTRTPTTANVATPTNSGSSGDAGHGGVQLRLGALDSPNAAIQFHYVLGSERWVNLAAVEWFSDSRKYLGQHVGGGHGHKHISVAGRGRGRGGLAGISRLTGRGCGHGVSQGRGVNSENNNSDGGENDGARLETNKVSAWTHYFMSCKWYYCSTVLLQNVRVNLELE